MNENKFISNRTHTRIKFEPLRTSCQLVCITPQSPCAQSVNTMLASPEWEPDRTLSPTVILPRVRVNDRDKVFPSDAGNASLSLDAMEWTVDGNAISEVWTAGEDADYTILTEGDERGALKVYKNLNAGEKAVLRFKGKLFDWRTGIVYNVESDGIALTSTDKGADKWSCSVDKPIIEYDPYKDRLLAYDYRAARGMSVIGTRDDNKDGKSFEQTVNVVLTQGTKELDALPEGLTMQVVKNGTTTVLEPGAETSAYIIAASYPNVTFDMRMIDKAEMDIQFVKDKKVICHSAIGLSTVCTMPTSGRPANGADIPTQLKQYVNRALVYVNGALVDNPELLYGIQWHTQTRKQQSDGTYTDDVQKNWQRGEYMQVNVSDIGMGSREQDSSMMLWFDADAWDALDVLADENGNVLTDSEGAILIG